MAFREKGEIKKTYRCSFFLVGFSSPNWRGSTSRGGGCGLIGFNARHLTRGDSRMMVTLKGLPDKLRGVAWPSSARAVRCAVKSVKSDQVKFIPPK